LTLTDGRRQRDDIGLVPKASLKQAAPPDAAPIREWPRPTPSAASFSTHNAAQSTPINEFKFRTRLHQCR
jgi:hypothetical protein